MWYTVKYEKQKEEEFDMCLKLKNKILQVIEIISNYGLIFAIYKFILFIIKNLFRRLIFDIKHYRNDYRKIEARKKYLNYFQEKQLTF